MFSDRKPALQPRRPFNQFDPIDIEQTQKFLTTLTIEGKQNPEKSIQHAKEAIERGESPLMIKLALSIFLTHSRKAHLLGIVTPSLRQYSEFTHRPVKDVPLTNPVSADTIQGYGKLAYWQEDYDLNDHHNHWHIVYPHIGIPVDCSPYVRHGTIDRQGELFLYMHSQMLARYNAELLSWGMDTVPAFNYGDYTLDGYVPAPHLTVRSDTQQAFTPRPACQGWNKCAIKQQVKARDNILHAIHSGYFVTKRFNCSGETVGNGCLMLTPENAMNWVGVVVEAQSEALQEVVPNEFIDHDLYGSLHNNGHDYFSKIGSKDDKYGVMGSTLVAIRDPVFFLWHRHIDEFRRMIVEKYSHSINEFKPAARLVMVKIFAKGTLEENIVGEEYTNIKTFLGPPQLELNEVNAKVGHEAYQWKIVIRSTRRSQPTEADPQIVTVRLFIVPEGYQEDQHAWIEMDKFTQKLTRREMTIIRTDDQSTVARKVDGSKWCKCGWPQNMMLPIGTKEGMPFIAFAMLTNDRLAEVYTYYYLLLITCSQAM